MAAGDRLKDGTYQVINCSTPSSAPLALNSTGAIDTPTRLQLFPVDGTDAELVTVYTMKNGIRSNVQRMHMPAQGLSIDVDGQKGADGTAVQTASSWADSPSIYYNGYSGAYLSKAQQWDILQTGETWSCTPTVGDLWKGSSNGLVYSDSGDTYYWNGTHWLKASDLSVASFSTVLYPVYKILWAKLPEYGLEVCGTDHVEGNALDIWHISTADDYKWIFVPRNTIRDGVYNIVTAMQDNALMECAYGGSGNGVLPIVGYYNSAVAYQTFLVQTGADGSTRIRPTFGSTDYFLACASSVIAKGDAPHFWHTESYDANAIFIIEPQGVITSDSNNQSAPGFRIVPYNGQSMLEVLDVANGSTTIGTNIRFWSRNDSMAQRFDFVPALPLDKTLGVPVPTGGSLDGSSLITRLCASGLSNIFPAFKCKGTYFTIRYKLKYVASADGYMPTGNEGKNLLSNTAGPFVHGYPSSGYSDFSNFHIPLCTENEYTVSFIASSTVDGDKIYCYFYSPNTTTKAVTSQGVSSTSSDGKVAITLTTTPTFYWIKYTQNATAGEKLVIVGRTIYGEGTGTVTVKNVKAEEGEGATSWTPSPEDVNNGIAYYNGAVDLEDIWLNILTNKPGNHGWGTAASPDTSLPGSDNKIAKQSIPVTLTAAKPLVELEYEVALWAARCTKFKIPGRGPSGLGRIMCVFRPTVTISDVVFTIDGMRVSYSSDVKTSSNKLTFTDSTLLSSSYTIKGQAASGTVVIPYSYLRTLPDDGVAVNMKCLFVTCDGGSNSTVYSGVVNFNESHGMTLSPTISHQDTPWVTIASNLSAAVYYMLIEKGHGSRFFYIGTGSTMTALPPIGIPYRIFGLVQNTDGTSWGTWSEEFSPIIEEPRRYHWDFDNGRAVLAFNTDAPGATFVQTMTADATANKVAGREHDVFTFGSDVSNTLDATGVLTDGPDLPDNIMTLPYSTRDCFDALAYAKHAVFRSSNGFWAQVAITGYTIEESTQDIPRITVKQSEESV